MMNLQFFTSLALSALCATQTRAEITADEYLQLAQSFNTDEGVTQFAQTAADEISDSSPDVLSQT